jgi:hypothetical protein
LDSKPQDASSVIPRAAGSSSFAAKRERRYKFGVAIGIVSVSG